MPLKMIQKKEGKNCTKCMHIEVCIIYLGIVDIILEEDSPIKAPEPVLEKTAESCELYYEKEDKNEVDGCRGTSG